MAAGRFEEAEPALLSSYERLAVVLGARSLRTRQTAKYLVELYEKWGKPDKAEQWRSRLAAGERGS